MVDFEKVLSKAFNISQDLKFLVRIYENKFLYIESKMTYFELGTYLFANPDKIKIIHIYLKSN